MRVAMVSEHASPLAVVGGVDAGGQNVHVAALSTALAQRGHEVVVYTRRDAPGLPTRARLAPGVSVVHLDAGPAAPVPKDELLPYVPELGRSLARALARDRPDVLHAHFWMSGLACADALRLVGRTWGPGGRPALVQTFHALGTVKRRWLGAQDPSPAPRLAAEATLTQQVDALLATCSDEVAELVAMGVDPARVDVVPCGVDVAHFTPDGPAAARTDRRRLLVLGRLVPRKGVEDAIEALTRLTGPATAGAARSARGARGAHRDVELVVAGGPAVRDLDGEPEAARLRALAERLGVGERVHLVGRVPRAELPALLRSADVALCLPWYEPFGIVPLEAMACGVPVVGSAVGGLLDSVAGGVTGTLVPARRPDLVARAVASLLDDEPRRIAYGRAGVSRARELYAWPRVAAGTEAVYERAVRRAAAMSGDGASLGAAGELVGTE